jgi:hypothetical protein
MPCTKSSSHFQSDRETGEEKEEEEEGMATDDGCVKRGVMDTVTGDSCRGGDVVVLYGGDDAIESGAGKDHEGSAVMETGTGTIMVEEPSHRRTIGSHKNVGREHIVRDLVVGGKNKLKN